MEKLSVDGQSLFISPTKGCLTLSKAIGMIIAYVGNDQQHEYKLSIGSDSMSHDGTCFVHILDVFLYWSVIND